MNRSEIAESLKRLSEEMPEEEKEQLAEAATIVAEPDSDVTAIHRMLMELLVELPEEQRAQAEELVTALAALAETIQEPLDEEMEMEEDAVDETLVMEEEEMEDTEDVEMDEAQYVEDEEKEDEEEMTMDREGETKELSDELVEQVVESMHLKDLSDLLETQNTAVKGALDAIDELAKKLVGIGAKVEVLEKSLNKTADLEREVKEVKEEVSGVKEQTDSVVAEKQRWTPFWANGITGVSVARETEVSESDAKAYRKPEIPNPIAGIRNRMLRQD